MGMRGGRGPQPTMDKPKREAILDLTKYVNERIRVKFAGGREGALSTSALSISLNCTITATGVLKGFDQLLNLVLDDVEENLQTGTPPPASLVLTCSHRQESEQTTRSLGLVVCRGPTITLLSPVDGSEEIANPFGQPEA